jgi:dUTP pyrophosphatase
MVFFKSIGVVMQVKIKRVDKTLPLPIYETKGSVGFDLISREEMIILPGQIALIPSNIIVETPKGYMLQVASRSSSPGKKGLMPPHGIGIVDTDYCGNDDEVMIQVYNFTEKPTTVSRGEKIAQGIFVRVETAIWSETDDMDNESRGGFGSTDKK